MSELAAQKAAHRYLNECKDDYAYLRVFGGRYDRAEIEVDTYLSHFLKMEPCDTHVMLVLIFACSSLDAKVLNPSRFNDLVMSSEHCKNITEQMVHDMWDVIRSAPKRARIKMESKSVDKMFLEFQKKYGRALYRLRHLRLGFKDIEKYFSGVRYSHHCRMESGVKLTDPMHGLAALKMYEYFVSHDVMPDRRELIVVTPAELTEQNVQRHMDAVVHGLQSLGIIDQVPGPVHIRHEEDGIPCTDATYARQSADRVNS